MEKESTSRPELLAISQEEGYQGMLSPSGLEEVTLESPSSASDVLGTPHPPAPPSSPALVIHVGSPVENSSPAKQSSKTNTNNSSHLQNKSPNKTFSRHRPTSGETNSLSSCSSASSPMLPVVVAHKTRYTTTVKPLITPSSSKSMDDACKDPALFFTYVVVSKRLLPFVNVPQKSPLKNSHEKQQDLQPSESEAFTVKRVWEDFEFLHQCLTMAAFPSSNGLIIPSLPSKVVPSESRTGVNAYDHLVKQFSQMMSRHESPSIANNNHSNHPSHGSPSHSSTNPYVKAMMTPNFRSDCHQLEEYLNLMLCHPTFGKNIDVWERFLMSEKPAPRLKGGVPSIPSRGSTAGLTALSSYSAAALHHRDCDEFFQKERDWVHLYSDVTKECLQSLNSNLEAKSSE